MLSNKMRGSFSVIFPISQRTVARNCWLLAIEIRNIITAEKKALTTTPANSKQVGCDFTVKCPMNHTSPRALTVCMTAVTLVACLVSLPATAQVNNFTGADNDRWFNDLNWSLGHVPISAEDAVIPALAAYAYEGEGATIQCDQLYVGSTYAIM